MVTVSSRDADYRVEEATRPSFRSSGEVQTTISGEAQGQEHSIDAEASIELRVATAEEMERTAVADIDLEWDGEAFVRYAQYSLYSRVAETIVPYRYISEEGRVPAFGESVERVARRLFDLEPLYQSPEFLFPTRHPDEGPPPIDDPPGTFVDDDIQYQLRGLGTHDSFCTDWLSHTEIVDHFLSVKNSGKELLPDYVVSTLANIAHIGAGPPELPDASATTYTAFACHNGGYSIGLWFPHQPVDMDRIGELADQLGARRITAVETFPTDLFPQVPPAIWNCLPEPNWQLGDDNPVLTPCMVQLTDLATHDFIASIDGGIGHE